MDEIEECAEESERDGLEEHELDLDHGPLTEESYREVLRHSTIDDPDYSPEDDDDPGGERDLPV